MWVRFPPVAPLNIYMLKWLRKTIIAVLILITANCAALDGYERRYGLAYYDEEGHKVEATVSLVPVKPKPTINATK